MRLTGKGRYAVTAMLELAVNGGDGPVSLAEISEKHDISLSYLEQLFAALRKKKLVKGLRGPGGGYFLAKSTEKITVADIICAVDEWVALNLCKKRKTKAKKELTQQLWDGVSRDIFDFVSTITLADILKNQEAKPKKKKK